MALKVKKTENRKTSFIFSKAFCPALLPTFTFHILHSLPHPPSNICTAHLEYNTKGYNTIHYRLTFALSSSCLLFQTYCFSLFSYSLLDHSDTSPISVLGMYQAFSCPRNKLCIQVFSVFVEKSAVRSNICSCEYIFPSSPNLWLLLPF